MAIKIIVTIDIGRKSQSCTRAGICSITIGAELALKPHQDLGILEWEPGAATARLTFKGRETPHEQGIFALILDEPIKLPFNCKGATDPFYYARPGRYLTRTDNHGEFITLELSAIHPLV